MNGQTLQAAGVMIFVVLCVIFLIIIERVTSRHLRKKPKTTAAGVRYHASGQVFNVNEDGTKPNGRELFNEILRTIEATHIPFDNLLKLLRAVLEGLTDSRMVLVLRLRGPHLKFPSNDDQLQLYAVKILTDFIDDVTKGSHDTRLIIVEPHEEEVSA